MSDHATHHAHTVARLLTLRVGALEPGTPGPGARSREGEFRSPAAAFFDRRMVGGIVLLRTHLGGGTGGWGERCSKPAPESPPGTRSGARPAIRIRPLTWCFTVGVAGCGPTASSPEAPWTGTPSGTGAALTCADESSVSVLVRRRDRRCPLALSRGQTLTPCPRLTSCGACPPSSSVRPGHVSSTRLEGGGSVRDRADPGQGAWQAAAELHAHAGRYIQRVLTRTLSPCVGGWPGYGRGAGARSRLNDGEQG